MSVVHGNGFGIQGVGKVSGSVASFADSNGASLRSCIVTMEPIRLGTGDPSPDNIRPISGRMACSVYSAPSIVPFKPSQSGTPTVDAPKLIVPGLTFGRDDGTTLTVYGGELDTATQTLTRTMAIFSTSSLSGVAAVTSVTPRGEDDVSFWIYCGTTLFHLGANTLSNMLTYRDDPNDYQQFTFSTSQAYMHSIGPIVMPTSLVGSSEQTIYNYLKNNPIQFCLRIGTPVTYQLSRAEVTRAVEALGVTPVAVQLGRTVYRGTLDVATGKMTVTWGAIDGGDKKWTRYTTNSTSFALIKLSPIPLYIQNKITAISSIMRSFAPPTNSSPQPFLWVSSDRDLRVKWADKESLTGSQFQSLMAGVTFCYQFATPQIFQLTPAQVSTVLGANTVWSPDGDTAVEYYKKSMLFMG